MKRHAGFNEAGFFDRAVPEPNSGCLLWLGRVDSQGYGMLTINTRHVSAHRKAYEMARGPIPKGLFVCHTCDTPSCINPDHLFAETAADNMRDAKRKGRLRGRCSDLVECKRGHAFTSENTYWTTGRGGKPMRQCLQCQNARWAARRSDPERRRRDADQKKARRHARQAAETVR